MTLRPIIMIAVVLSLLQPTLIHAQEAPERSPALVRYGKWVLLAASGAMNIMAASEHNRAESQFDVIREACFEDDSRCVTNASGAYQDQALEAVYQASLSHDRRARRWLIGGEAALAGAAIMFVWEFTRPRGGPDNIPFEPQVEYRYGVTELGVRFRF